MSSLADALRPLVDSRLVPGLVAAVGRGDDLNVVVLGEGAVDGRRLERDSLFRMASLTKPMVAAAALTFVADGTLELDQPVGGLLPELAAPTVVRSLSGPVDDTVPARRPITLRHLLTSTNGHGFPSDFSAPVAQLLVERLLQGPPSPQQVSPPDEWMAILGGIPLLHQPGEGFTYNATFDILGVLLARSSDSALPALMATRLFEPLAMTSTGFAFPAGTEQRRTSYYRHGDDGLAVQDGPDGQWATIPAFASGAGGLASTGRRRHLHRGRRDSEAPPPSPTPPELITDDPAADFARARDEMLQAFGEPGVLGKTGISLGIAFSDQLMHGWDLARATGQDETMPDTLPGAAYELIYGRFTADERKGIFKPEVTVRADASPQEKLLAYTGRPSN